MTTNNSGNTPLNTVFWPKKNDDSQKKKKYAAPPKFVNTYESPVELFRNLGKKTADTVRENVAAAKNDIAKQIFGEMMPGQDVNLKNLHQQEAPLKPEIKAPIRPGLEQRDYVGEILRAGEEANKKESEETKQQVEKIIVELRKLSQSAKELEQKVVEATGPTMVKPGKYHKHFLDHVLSVIRDAKTKIDNAGSWLSAMKGKQKKGLGMGKKKPKSDYWNQVQKHGTKYMLSGERATATQAGG